MNSTINVKQKMKIIPDYFYQILDALEDGIYISDHQGNTLWNNKVSRIWLRDFQGDFMGKNVTQLEQEGIFRPSIIKLALQAGKTVTAVQDVNGQKFMVTGHLIHDEQGQVCYVVAHTRDLSQVGESAAKVEFDDIYSILLRYIQEFRNLNLKHRLNQTKNSFVGKSKAHSKLLEIIETVSNVESTVLITGETGVGKNVVAQQIHDLSVRSNKAFIQVNCASIPESLLESELFGYKKGAFTGASNTGKEGLVKLAEGGTLFLDEISEIPVHLQAKLLQLLQDKTYMPIGDSRLHKVDIRIIAASNLDLEEQVKLGKFRADLFFRLNILPIHIPPLRERTEDIFHLLQFYLQIFNERHNRNISFSKEVINILQEYTWPGNVRELENLVEQLVIMAKRNDILLSDLPDRLYHQAHEHKLSWTIPEQETLPSILESIEKELIERAYRIHGTTRKAAQALGITQSLFIRRLAKYNIKKEHL